MFKFILLTLLIVGVTMAADEAGGYDETADIVEMAFESAADNYDYNFDNGIDNYSDDLAEDGSDVGDGVGYMYNEGDLEDNINIAINAAILDKYGQAVSSVRSADASKVDAVEQPTEVDVEPAAEAEPAEEAAPTEEEAEPAAEVEQSYNYGVEAKSETVEQVEQPEFVERTSKGLSLQAKKKAPYTDNKPAVKTAQSSATPVKHPQYDDNDTITRFVSQVNADGTYGFDFAQSSGLEFKEVGQGGLYAQGSYQYVSPEGEHISVTYKADENGFHPESDSLPTPPPIPAYILKALKYIREHPTAEELADREVRAQQV